MSFDFSTLITDRTQADLRDLKSLLARAGSLTEGDRVEFNLSRHKGAYNYTDLNRVAEAMEYLDGILSARGYKTGYQRINLPRPGSYQDVVLSPDSVEEGEEYDTYTFTAPGSGAFFCEADYGTGVNSATVEVDVGGEYSIDLSDTTQWLYHEGDECESITGGWDSPSIKTTGYYWDSQSAYTDAPVCTKNGDNLYVKIVHRAGYYGISAASFWVKNAIDLTGISTLYFEINLLVGHCRFMVSDKNPFTTQFDCNKTSPKYPVHSELGENVLSVDVSDLNGAYYIGFGTELYADYAYTAEVKLKSVWLE